MGAAARASLVAVAAAFMVAPVPAWAQSPPGPAPAAVTLPTIEVIGTTPLLGSGIDRDKVPANARALSPDDITRDGPPSLAGALSARAPSVTITDVQDTPYQPDIQYRGFDASPVSGTPQGLAIYQNGVRINEAFGDTVNWDLVPDFAINRVNLTGANPVFGLNALGGALALEMKNGFNFQGGQAQASGGSFGRREGTLEYGIQAGGLAAYIGGRGLYDEGWRDHSPSSIHQLYADLGAEGHDASAHLSFAGASNLINAIGPTPVELLAQSRSAVYTTPQSTRNDLAFLTLTGSYKANDTLALDANAYYRHFRQRISNGNTTEAQACTPPGAFLCFGDGATPLTGTNGQPIPDVLNGATPGEIDRTATDTDGLGASLQLTETRPVFGHDNHFVLGASLDHGATAFRADSELGIIEPSLLVSGTGLIIDQPTGDLAPVNLATTNSYYGFYATDTIDVTEQLAVTVSGRFNVALIRLTDLGGTSLNGDHRFSRFNPAAGATYKIAPWLTGYAGYSEANRAPTPGELACADPARPCIIDNFLVSDPALKQVVAHTYETGLRGSIPAAEPDGHLSWNLGFFRTDSEDDILAVPSPVISGFGFFTNAGSTRRQGIEAGLHFRSETWLASVDYDFLDATFRSPLTLNSPNNPFADANGTISVKPGDHLPSLPAHHLKFALDYNLTPRWKIGGDLIVVSGQYLRGDESNQNPKIPGYHVVNLRTSYAIGDNAEIFGLVKNALDEKYDTFGTFFAPGQIGFLGLTNPRTESPAAPIGVFVGGRVTF